MKLEIIFNVSLRVHIYFSSVKIQSIFENDKKR